MLGLYTSGVEELKTIEYRRSGSPIYMYGWRRPIYYRSQYIEETSRRAKRASQTTDPGGPEKCSKAKQHKKDHDIIFRLDQSVCHKDKKNHPSHK